MPYRVTPLQDIPQDIKDKLFATMRQKLPADVDDTVITDILTTNMQIVRDYMISLYPPTA